MNHFQIYCIVLSYNGKELTLQCLESLLKQDYKTHEIIVVDNASQDDTVATINSKYPDIEVIASRENLGYAAGNNCGMEAALERGADLIFLINNDTILAPDCISNLADTFLKNPKAGIVGPMVYTFDPGNIISSAGGKINWKKADSINVGAGEEDHHQYQARSVDFINGCGLMIRREAIQQSGFLDESYFMYWEETDWCTRVNKAGWQILFNPAAMMRHKAPITSEQLSPTTLYYMARNRLRFFSTHARLTLKPIALTHAIYGIIRGYYLLKKEKREQHAKAMQVALLHGIIGKGDYVKPSWLK